MEINFKVGDRVEFAPKNSCMDGMYWGSQIIYSGAIGTVISIKTGRLNVTLVNWDMLAGRGWQKTINGKTYKNCQWIEEQFLVKIKDGGKSE